MAEIVDQGVQELASAIRGGRTSAVEVLAAHVAQIEKRNPALNAIVTLNAEGALRRAREADAALALGNVWGPLHGVPFALKDAHATAGVRTTSGYPPLDHVPNEDGTVAARLKAAGGILLGKTNVATLLGDPGQTDNPIFGRTNNPWNPARTPGGSSGGAAAAVASGMTPFDIGTDLAGSIRIPAHFCGVFGLKPTEHRVSLAGVIPGASTPRSVRIMSCVGPLARGVDDLALLYSIIAGPDGRDTDMPPVPVESEAKVALRTLRVAFAPDFPGLPAAAAIRAAVTHVATELAALCDTVGEARLPVMDLHEELARAGELIGMTIGAFQPDESGRLTALARYFEALDRRDRAIIAWERFFARWDVLICPVSMMTAFPHCQSGSPLRVDGREVEYWAVNAHTTLFNYSGNPAVVIPCGADGDGLPIGIQLVGKRWSDARLLAIAREVSLVAGGSPRLPA